MSKNDHPCEETLHDETQQQEEPVTAPQEEPAEECAAPADEALSAALEREERALTALKEKEDQFLRLAAEYENFRRRSQKEKESIWADAKFDTALAFLPVYDNLERALKLECADAAYQKGVEMTMTQLKEVLAKLGVEEIPALGQPFDPTLHNAVMHVEEEGAGENTVVEVFQTGFQSGEKVIRFAMVKVAN
jgi:molecular chaperone GrpE